MKKIIKPLLVFILGIISGYYVCFTGSIKDLFTINYKAFQIGVYADIGAANTLASKYDNAIVISDNELYRVYIAILKNKDNIEYMSNYLDKNNISYYIRDIEINSSILKKEISEYENIMDSNSEVVFLELNKMITKIYKESL